ncbi:MAG: DUF4214 domain-containing protein [Acidimicrobiales bacterium]
MLRRALAALTTALCLIGSVAVPASAATVAPDYQTAVRTIVFPVAGPNYTYGDTFGACRSGCSRGHEGTDIMTPKLTELLAARDATVTWSKDTATPDGSQGNYLMLTDSEGWEYWYIHINIDSPGTDDGANPEEWIFAPGIGRGSEVVAGQHIAYAGDSGNAEGSGSHLHFEIHKPDGSIINPYQSLQAAEKTGPAPADARSGESDERFVQALALDFLDRPSSASELARDTDRLAGGASRAEVVDGYAQSREWVSVLITQFYASTLDRAPDARGLDHWIDQINGGMTPAAVASRFYASPEYFNRSGGTTRAWVTDLYREILLRAPDAAGLEHWARKADAGMSRIVIATDFYGSLESRRTRVTGLYASLLGRAPDSGGLSHWADRLTDGRDLELAVLLASGPEYYQRATTRTDLG